MTPNLMWSEVTLSGALRGSWDSTHAPLVLGAPSEHTARLCASMGGSSDAAVMDREKSHEVGVKSTGFGTHLQASVSPPPL